MIAVGINGLREILLRAPPVLFEDGMDGFVQVWLLCICVWIISYDGERCVCEGVCDRLVTSFPSSLSVL